MTRFNTTDRRSSTVGPLTVSVGTEHTNHQGGVGYSRTDQADLYLLATTSHDLTANAFYENGDARVKRFVDLTARCAVADPDWTYRFLTWLRTKGNMRTAALVGGVEAARAMAAAGIPGGRHMVSTVLRRADEPGEAVAYYMARYGRALPKPIKRGIADAATRLYNEYALLKYDTAAHGVRFGDVLDLTHPTPRYAPGSTVAGVARAHGVDPADVEEALRQTAATIRRQNADGAPVALSTAEFMGMTGSQVTGWRARRAAQVIGISEAALAAEVSSGPHSWQADLFRYAIDRRHGHDSDTEIYASLNMIKANAAVRAQWASDDDAFDLDPDRLRAAGMTWEDVMSAVGGNVTDKATVWRNLIPIMGFMARLRNLRNFDEAGLSDGDVADVLRMLRDPDAVRASKQLPLRFLSAYRAAPNLRWSYPLQQALDISVENIPALPGRTLILIDTSGSMKDRLSGHTDLLRWDAAAAFGLALARRCETVDVVSYSGGASQGYAPYDSAIWEPRAGESLLTSIDRWNRDGYMIGGGTDTVRALANHYQGHDRVVLLTDEQDGGYYSLYGGTTAKVSDQIPADKYLHTINLAGYESSHAATNPYRITLGGLTDHMFGIISQVENRRPGQWPWTGDPDIPALPLYPRPTGAVTHR